MNQNLIKIGDKLIQRRSNAIAYAVVIGFLKNGSLKVVAIEDDRRVAFKTSTNGWWPTPEKFEGEIPPKLMAKIEKKLKG